MLPTPISERKCGPCDQPNKGSDFSWSEEPGLMWPWQFLISILIFFKFHIPKSGSIKKWWCFACFPLPSLKENVAPCDQPSKGIEFSMIRWPWANLALAIWHFHLFFLNSTCQNLPQKIILLVFCLLCIPIPQRNLTPCDQPNTGADFSIVRRAWANVTLLIFDFNFAFSNFNFQNQEKAYEKPGNRKNHMRSWPALEPPGCIRLWGAACRHPRWPQAL